LISALAAEEVEDLQQSSQAKQPRQVIRDDDDD